MFIIVFVIAFVVGLIFGAGLWDMTQDRSKRNWHAIPYNHEHRGRDL